MKRTPLSSFVIASSLPVIVWPLFGLAMATRRTGAEFDFSIAAIFIPLVFGAYHAATVALGVKRSPRNTLIAGAILGLFLSSLGTFVLRIPETVYGMEGNTIYLMLLGGPLFYGAVWFFALRPLENYLYDR